MARLESLLLQLAPNLNRRADRKPVLGSLAGDVSVCSGRRNRLLPLLESVSAATDLDLSSYPKAIPDVSMRRAGRFLGWYL